MPTVLLVDDEFSIRRALRQLFERAGWIVIEAGSGADAIATLDAGTGVDAVVSDVLMPGVSGLAFYDELTARAPKLRQRVVFLTGAAQDPKVHASIEERGVPLISKLDDFELVLDAVRLAVLRR